jgi:hypothetical protein
VVPTRLAELETCSKPFPDIPRIFALSRPTGAKGGRRLLGCRRKFRESFPPLCFRRRGKLAVGCSGRGAGHFRLAKSVGGGEKGYQFGGREGAMCGVTLWPAVGAEIGKKLTASSLRPACRRF